MSSPKYQKVLVIGGTSGIGEDLARKFVEEGSKVIVVGRRKERLQSFVSKYPKNATSIVFDVTKLSEIPAFAASVAKDHPDLDCVVLNSGIQRVFDFSKPSTVDLDVVQLELTTNYTSCVYLTVALLPFLQTKPQPTSMIYISAGLALVPGLLRCGNYCASKAALHSWILVLREQVHKGPGNVKIVEVFPPAVQTEIHDEKFQPDLKNGGEIGMPLAEFTQSAWEGLMEGSDEVAVGGTKFLVEGFEKDRKVAFYNMIAMVEKLFKSYLK